MQLLPLSDHIYAFFRDIVTVAAPVMPTRTREAMKQLLSPVCEDITDELLTYINTLT